MGPMAAAAAAATPATAATTASGAGAAAGGSSTVGSILGTCCHTFCAGWTSAMCCFGTCTCLVCTAVAAPLVLGGGGKKHKDLKFEQAGLPCGECCLKVATVTCRQCTEIYCEGCCSIVHSKGFRVEHCDFHPIPDTRFFLPDQLCGNCGDNEAIYFCPHCREVYCLICKVQVHSKGLRQHHTDIRPIGKAMEPGFDEELAEKLLMGRRKKAEKKMTKVMKKPPKAQKSDRSLVEDPLD